MPMGPYISAQIVAVLFAAASWCWPRTARVIGASGFLLAGAFNAFTAFTSPSSYVSGFGPQASPVYQEFIYGVFARHTTSLVLAIAIGQLTAGALMFLHGIGRKLGYIGATAFLVAITPLGIGSAAPSTMMFAIGIALLYRFDDVPAVAPRSG